MNLFVPQDDEFLGTLNGHRFVESNGAQGIVSRWPRTFEPTNEISAQ